jgi:alanyl-tRNA synthetase
MEIVADHVRAATFILGDDRGISPSKVDQGYVLRRFIRRAIRHARLLNIDTAFLQLITTTYIDIMGEAYPELTRNRRRIMDELANEEQLFSRTVVEAKNIFACLWIHFKTIRVGIRLYPA